MSAPFQAILAATTPLDFTISLMAFAFVATLVVAIKMWTDQVKQRKALERRLQSLLAEREQTVGPAELRNAAMFQQHTRINDLQIAKLTAEVELLQRQVKSTTLNEDRIEASKEYHELMVEKAKLEMDGLRLHNAEARRRMEDWRIGDE